MLWGIMVLATIRLELYKQFIEKIYRENEYTLKKYINKYKNMYNNYRYVHVTYTKRKTVERIIKIYSSVNMCSKYHIQK